MYGIECVFFRKTFSSPRSLQCVYSNDEGRQATRTRPHHDLVTHGLAASATFQSAMFRIRARARIGIDGSKARKGVCRKQLLDASSVPSGQRAVRRPGLHDEQSARGGHGGASRRRGVRAPERIGRSKLLTQALKLNLLTEEQAAAPDPTVIQTNDLKKMFAVHVKAVGGSEEPAKLVPKRAELLKVLLEAGLLSDADAEAKPVRGDRSAKLIEGFRPSPSNPSKPACPQCSTASRTPTRSRPS